MGENATYCSQRKGEEICLKLCKYNYSYFWTVWRSRKPPCWSSVTEGRGKAHPSVYPPLLASRAKPELVPQLLPSGGCCHTVTRRPLKKEYTRPGLRHSLPVWTTEQESVTLSYFNMIYIREQNCYLPLLMFTLLKSFIRQAVSKSSPK